MRTLVTGAAGFIGSNLVDRLLAEGHRVIGIDNLRTGTRGNLEHAFQANNASRFSVIEADVQAPELSDIIADASPDVVFHLAAQVDLRASVSDPEFDARTNVLGTINVCEASRRAGVQRIVYAASGGSRYGAPTQLPVSEEHPVGPLSPYAVAKLAGELYLNAYSKMYGMTSICLALSNVYGPRQNPHGEAGVIAIFGSGILAGRSVTVYGDGTAARDYVYVDDVVDAFVRASCAPPCIAGTYNIGTGQQRTVAEVHSLISAVVDGASPPRYEAARAGEVHAIALDTTKAESELGWKPTIDLTEGIRRTIRWLRATHELESAAMIDA